MQERLSPEHSAELITDTLEKLLNGRRVANECGGHLQSTGRDGAKRSLDVVGDPFDEVRSVLVLHVPHLFLNFLHRDLASEDGRACEVATVSEVGRGHHILGVIHLLGKLRHGDGTEGMSTSAGERSEANHEEVETGERNHVDGQFAEVGVQLTRESEAGGHTGHDSRHKMVEISVGRVAELEGSHANLVQSLYIYQHSVAYQILKLRPTSLSMQKVSSEFSTS